MQRSLCSPISPPPETLRCVPGRIIFRGVLPSGFRVPDLPDILGYFLVCTENQRIAFLTPGPPFVGGYLVMRLLLQRERSYNVKTSAICLGKHVLAFHPQLGEK